MIALPLSCGKQAVIDDDDAHLAAHKWSYLRGRNGNGYAVRSHAGRFLYLHREVIGAPPGAIVDHRDGDGLNCRRENLRLASHAQNLANRGRQRNNTSGCKGVTWDRSREVWRVEIQVNGRRANLGRFAMLEDAARAQRTASRILLGEFAQTEGR